MTEPLLAGEALTFAYGPERPVLRGASFALHAGERLGLTGPNGAGKSTLFRLLVGLLRPHGGTIIGFGSRRQTEADFADLRRRAALVFQHADDQLFSPTVLEDVAFGPLNLGASPDAARARSAEALEQVGLSGFEERITYRLSGGEKRLVAIATVLAMEPEVLLLDEPTSGLDEAAQARLDALLQTLPQAMILVCHSGDFLQRHTTRCIELRNGRLH